MCLLAPHGPECSIQGDAVFGEPPPPSWLEIWVSGPALCFPRVTCSLWFLCSVEGLGLFRGKFYLVSPDVRAWH